MQVRGTENRPADRGHLFDGPLREATQRVERVGAKVLRFAAGPPGRKLASAAPPGRVAERTEERLYVERSFLV